jgi:hypothetical protein
MTTGAPPTALPSSRTTISAFLAEQIGHLEPFDFVVTTVAGRPLDGFEVERDDQDRYHVHFARRVPETAAGDDLRQRLSDCGLSAQSDEGPWTTGPVPTAEAAATALEQALAGVFGYEPGAPLDVRHGSHRALHEAQAKVETLRERIVPLLTRIFGEAPTTDPDGDFVVRYESAQVFVAPRVAMGGVVVVRVFAVTNLGVAVTPQLALFLARLNFGLVFGRFSLDVDHDAVWFDETLLGDRATDEDLEFSVRMVASTANKWDDQIKQMFGGVTAADLPVATDRQTPPPKPGEGGYL